MATIKDIAKAANLGTSTVSRYLNNSGQVSKDAAQRIEKACEELKYIPNSIARSLRTRKTNTIALLLPDLEDLFFPKLAAVVEGVCSSRGYRLILCNSKGDVEVERNYIDLLLQGNVDGVILTSHVDANSWISRIRNSVKHPLPIVILDRIPKEIEFEMIATITGDHEQGAILATSHLVDSGCDYLIHITEDIIFETSKLRKEAFTKICNDNQLPGVVLTWNEFSELDLNNLVNKHKVGVFSWTDMLAAKALKYIQSKGLHIPDDIHLIGYDDLVICTMTSPSLSTIRQPLDEIGRCVAETLLDMIENKEEPEDTIMFQNELIIRESTGGNV